MYRFCLWGQRAGMIQVGSHEDRSAQRVLRVAVSFGIACRSLVDAARLFQDAADRVAQGFGRYAPGQRSIYS